MLFFLSTLKIYGTEDPNLPNPTARLEVRIAILESALAKSERERGRLQRALSFDRAMQEATQETMQEALQEANLEQRITAFGLEQEITYLREDAVELEKQLQAALSHAQKQDDRVDARDAEIRDLRQQLLEAQTEIDGFIERDQVHSDANSMLRDAIEKLQKENAQLKKLLAGNPVNPS